MADAPPLPTSADFELPGAFYLGRGAADGQPLLLRSKELTTHGVILGQTGSGKTGLAIALLEEAAIDGIPAIVIDPKGDLANLLLHFPEQKPEDFQPWIDPAEAERKGMSVEDFAKKTALDWQDGLLAWGETDERLDRLAAAADYCVYTPGSTAGVPVSLLSSLAAPDEAIRDDPERFGERVAGTASALLVLIGVAADPLTDARHIFLTNLLQHAWGAGRSLGLEDFIRAIQKPGFTKVGLLPLDDFFPARDRGALALAFNNLLAAPSFRTWLEGEALDLGKMLVGPSGKPQVSVFSIAHLGDAERMFFVTMVLEAAIDWMRSQKGTGSLRALLYMDEVFGYLPPVENPPSKAPMLTLLKQARAYGLGVVLASQNPVDLDYKALSNAATWMIGRLQTERDVDRVLGGLKSAGADTNVAQLRAQFASMPQRRFLLHRADGSKLLFDVRWVMNYLAGPMTREDIRRLMEPLRSRFAGRNPVRLSTGAVDTGDGDAAPAGPARPVLPNGVVECFAPLIDGVDRPYRPFLLRSAEFRISDDRHRLDQQRESHRIVPLDPARAAPDWSREEDLSCPFGALAEQPAEGRGFAELPGWVTAAALKQWGRDFTDTIYATQRVGLWHARTLGESSAPGESREAFLDRLRHQAAEARDAALDKATAALSRRLATEEDQVRRALQRVDAAQEKRRGRWLQNILRLLGEAFGFFLGNGRKLTVTRTRSAGTALRGLVGGDNELSRAQENLDAELEDLERVKQELETERTRAVQRIEELEEVRVGPLKKDIRVQPARIVWVAR